ncbi:hypothetical protein HanXRQr2_Chr03g0101281 [Helianthus annuus]|uniref:Uncharacterized protein n=1 Tax=Helianthus annuus TaxID=4232 RepID=A0A9K3NVI6_HELAN|nr:hypothetical protein HanXRQr2_Chr03g0101281 [Helianthus annuus]KAJ0942890.1 hypothetical protein HanPSC8_Chr03g0097581 [Helianthus annuus]
MMVRLWMVAVLKRKRGGVCRWLFPLHNIVKRTQRKDRFRCHRRGRLLELSCRL